MPQQKELSPFSILMSPAMLRILCPLFFLSCLLAFSACDSDRKQAPDEHNKAMKSAVDNIGIYVLETVGDTAKYKEKNLFVQEKKRKDKEKKELSYIELSYPEFKQFAKKQVLDSINTSIDYLLRTQWDDHSAIFPSIEARMKGFISSYEEALDELKGLAPIQAEQWTCEVRIEVLLNTPYLLSLSLFESNYTGGAHPNQTLRFLNFNMQTGQSLKLEDLLIENAFEQLKPLAERRFRESAQTKGLKPEDYSFDNQGFYIPKNYYIREDALVFVYNPYEIGPYALGPLEFALPFDDFSDYINKAVLR